MIFKRDDTGKNYDCDIRPTKKSENLTEIADKLLINIEGKDMYYLGSNPIRNFHELNNIIKYLNVNHAIYVAAWIEHLGDKSTARKICETPSEFKTIINNRYQELKRSMLE